MTLDLRDWLAAYPGIKSISALALDADACGLIDLDAALARAVLLDVRLAAGLRRTEHSSLAFHQRAAHGFAKRRNRPEIRVVGGVAVLNGSIAAGCAVSQTRLAAVLHIDAVLPETVVALLPGQALAAVVDCPLLRIRDYTITSAEQHSHGLSLSFAVKTMTIPPKGVSRSIGSPAKWLTHR